MYKLARPIALGISLLSASAAADTLNDGLVAYFPFEGTHHTANGACFTVGVLGNPTYDHGAVGRAIRFDGVDDTLLVDHAGELSFDVDVESYTIAFYVKWDGSNDEDFVIQDRYGSNHAVSYNFGMNESSDTAGSSTWYGLDGTNRSFSATTTKSQFVDVWRHVAVTFDHTTGVKSLFVDGVLVDQADRPGGEYADPENDRITIGGYWGSNNQIGNWFAGLVDELRIYNRPLSESEIDQLVDLAYCPGDFNRDGVTNTLDVLLFLNAWNTACP